MYKNRLAPKKYIDPARRAELQERDRIRQEYYARLEREKQGIVEETPEPETVSPVVKKPMKKSPVKRKKEEGK